MTSTATIGAGRSLDDAIRRRMEHSFGTDLSDVRVHEGPQAADAADELEARAFAYGRHVVLGRSYAPGTDAGRRLLAHELAHVVQQAGHATAAPVAAQEADANTAAARAVAGAPARVAVGVTPQVARAPKDGEDEGADDPRHGSPQYEHRQQERQREESRQAGAERKRERQQPSHLASDEALEGTQVATREIKNKVDAILGKIRETQRPTAAQQRELDRLHEELVAIQRGDAAARKTAELRDERLHSTPARTPDQKAASRKREQQLGLQVNEAKGKVSEESQATGRKNVRRQVSYFRGQELSPSEAAARLNEIKRLKAAKQPHEGMRTVDEVTSRPTPDGRRQQVMVERKNNALDRMDAKGQNKAIGRVIGQLSRARNHEPEESAQVVKFTKRPATDERQADYERKLAARIFTRVKAPKGAKQTEPTEEVWFGNHRITRESAKKEIEAEKSAQAAKAKAAAVRKAANEAKAQAVAQRKSTKAKAAAEKKAEKARNTAEREAAKAAKEAQGVKPTPRKRQSKDPPSKATSTEERIGTKGNKTQLARNNAARPSADAAGEVSEIEPKQVAPPKGSKRTGPSKKAPARAATTAKPLAPAEQLATPSRGKTPGGRRAKTRTSTATDASTPVNAPTLAAKAAQTTAKPPSTSKTPATQPQQAQHEQPPKAGRPPAGGRRTGAEPSKSPAKNLATTTTPTPSSPETEAPRKTGEPGAKTRRSQIGAKVAAAAGAGDQVLSAIDAARQYGELRDGGATASEALGQLLVNQTEVGKIMATYENAVAGHQSKGEAVATVVGTQLGRFAPGGGATSAVIGVVNHAAHTLGAPQGVTDTTSLISEATPGSMASQLLTAGARSYYNLGEAALTGDTKGLDRMVGDMKKGGLGTPLQGYAMIAEGVADLAAGDDPEKILERLAKAGKGSVADRVGSYLGDKMWDLHEWATGNSDEDWKKQIEEINRRVEERRRQRQAAAGGAAP